MRYWNAKFVRGLALPAIPGVILILLWEIAGRFASNFAFFYGRPSAIIEAFLEDVVDGGLIVDTGVTSAAAIGGLLIGVVAGGIVALLLAGFPSITFIARPYVVFIGSVPVVAIAPILILWFGPGLPAATAVAALSIFALVASQAYDGLREAATRWGPLGETFGASRYKLFRYILLPGAIAWLFSSWRISIGLAFIGAFVGEFISANRGLGRYILKAGALYDAPRVFCGVFVIGFLSLTLTLLVQRVERSFGGPSQSTGRES